MSAPPLWGRTEGMLLRAVEQAVLSKPMLAALGWLVELAGRALIWLGDLGRYSMDLAGVEEEVCCAIPVFFFYFVVIFFLTKKCWS